MTFFLSFKFLGHFDGQCPWLKKIQGLLKSLAPVLEGEKLVCGFYSFFTGLVEFILTPVANCEAVAGCVVCFCLRLFLACFGFSAASVCSRMDLSTQSMSF
jgi:hypothetical protein